MKKFIPLVVLGFLFLAPAASALSMDNSTDSDLALGPVKMAKFKVAAGTACGSGGVLVDKDNGSHLSGLDQAIGFSSSSESASTHTDSQSTDDSTQL